MLTIQSFRLNYPTVYRTVPPRRPSRRSDEHLDSHKVVTKVVTEPEKCVIPTQKRISISSMDDLLCSPYQVVDSAHRNLDSRSITQ